MKPKQPQKFLRALVAAFLVVWIAAISLCTVDCAFGGQKGGAMRPCCRAHHAAHPGSADHETPCLMKQPVMTGAKISAAAPTIFHWSYLPAVELFKQSTTNVEVVAAISRQNRRDETSFTPELSLNAAFRSLAPPVSLS